MGPLRTDPETRLEQAMAIRAIPPVTYGAAVLGGLMSAFGCDCEEGNSIQKLAPEIAVEPMELDFGPVPVGATRALDVRIDNNGTDTLHVCARAGSTDCAEASRVDPGDAPFSLGFEIVSDNGRLEIPKGASANLAVRFSPVTEGPFEALVILTHDARNGPTTELRVVGVGVAPKVTVTPTELDFGEVTISQRKDLSLTLQNESPFAQPVRLGPIPLDQVAFGTRAGAREPGPNDPLEAEIPANGTLDVTVWFSPPEERRYEAKLPVSYCPTCSTEVTLRGLGTKPSVIVDPAAIDFGNLLPNQLPADRTFVVRNVGSTNASVYSVEMVPGSSSEFALAPQASFPALLTPGAELLVLVEYSGIAPGLDEGSVRVETSAWNDPSTSVDETIQFVSLRATYSGPDINPLPVSVNFGTVPILPAAPVARNLLLQNIGNTPLTISNIVFNSPTAEITVGALPSFPRAVAPGDSVTLALAYRPNDAGLDTAKVIVSSDDPDESTLTVEVRGIGGVPDTCSISVTPSIVNFGLVERGRVASLPLDVKNGGSVPCSVSGIHLEGDPSFTSASPPDVSIAPGLQHRVTLSYAPTAYANHQSELVFASDDPNAPTFRVQVSGASAPSDVRVIPSVLDFSTVPVTCGSPNRAVTVYNTGTSAVTVNRAYLDPSTSPEFSLNPFGTPATVPAGSSIDMTLRYRPADIGPDSGILFIEHSAAPAPVAVPLMGEGQNNPVVTDNFEQLPVPQADVLFVVDDSCSMADEQANLGANVTQFLSYAQSQSIDYQIGVTTTDVEIPSPTGPYQGGKQGRLVEYGGTRIITPATPNANSIFDRMVTALGIDGSGSEAGLEAAYLALTDPILSGWNAGFLRTDAALAVIIVSDEEDQSDAFRRGGTTAFYENFFKNIKGFGTTLFSMSAVIVRPIDSAFCSGGGATSGHRYDAVASATGGAVESICTANWGQTLANIGLNTFGLRRKFHLSAVPVAATIRITVDGVNVPAAVPGSGVQWAYVGSDNSVEFSPTQVPDASSVISITYTVACLP
ncbi:MAG: choice-of-anchor D domain-containing protein [Deltaproteobacteria bacterium]|nr:choice-of-anchor D domain-containing protein [Deltaproteobacteria bacterium]